MLWKKKTVKDDVKKTVKDFFGVEDVIDGIVKFKDDKYVAILEIIPVNFNLRSKDEKADIIRYYSEFLMSCNFPTQVLVQNKVADTSIHVKMMKQFYDREPNENVRHMQEGYINLVETLGSDNAVSRRFFLIIPYIVPLGIKKFKFNDVSKQLNEKVSLVKEHLPKCKIGIVELGNMKDTDFICQILYSFMCRTTSEVQKIDSFIDFTGVAAFTGGIRYE